MIYWFKNSFVNFEDEENFEFNCTDLQYVFLFFTRANYCK